MGKLGLKDSSRKLQTSYIISYFIYLYLILYACIKRFDVMKNLIKFWNFERN